MQKFPFDVEWKSFNSATDSSPSVLRLPPCALRLPRGSHCSASISGSVISVGVAGLLSVAVIAVIVAVVVAAAVIVAVVVVVVIVVAFVANGVNNGVVSEMDSLAGEEEEDISASSETSGNAAIDVVDEPVEAKKRKRSKPFLAISSFPKFFY